MNPSRQHVLIGRLIANVLDKYSSWVQNEFSNSDLHMDKEKNSEKMSTIIIVAAGVAEKNTKVNRKV